jgi:peroxiredoxin
VLIGNEIWPRYPLYLVKEADLRTKNVSLLALYLLDPFALSLWCAVHEIEFATLLHDFGHDGIVP